MPELDPLANSDAEMVAINALAFIAGEPELLDRFLALTGLDPAEIRQSAAEPGFLVGVLDFLMDHESFLLVYAASNNWPPDRIKAARNALSESRDPAN